MFQTDLNHRERAKMVEDVKALEEHVAKLRVALETADDTELMMEAILVALTWHGIEQPLRAALTEAAQVSKAKSDIDKFEGFNG